MLMYAKISWGTNVVHDYKRRNTYLSIDRENISILTPYRINLIQINILQGNLITAGTMF